MGENRKAEITLRDVEDSDLPIFFEHQKDPIARHQVAFTSKDPRDRNAFDTHWARIRNSDTVFIQTILFGQQIAGNILSFQMEGQTEIGYWIDRPFWGKGIATQALKMFLSLQPTRPIYAHVVHDNGASMKVLERCGFEFIGKEKNFSNARQEEVEEHVYRLDHLEPVIERES